MKQIPRPCTGCGRPRRPQRTRIAQWPGTVQAHNGTLCVRCAKEPGRKKTGGRPAARITAAHKADTVDRLPPVNTRWRDDAECLRHDPELFYSEAGYSTAAAKQICDGCLVKIECLTYALAVGEPYGVWGGATAAERADLLRGRRVPA